MIVCPGLSDFSTSLEVSCRRCVGQRRAFAVEYVGTITEAKERAADFPSRHDSRDDHLLRSVTDLTAIPGN